MSVFTWCLVVLGLWWIIGLITVICAVIRVTPELPAPRIKD